MNHWKRTNAALLAILFSMLLFSGCTVKSTDGKNGKENVDIKTPFGSIKVDETADPRDTGLPLYAGAKPYEKEGKDGHNSANVNISSGLLGVKVVVLEYTTPDPPDKVRDFYRKAMASYGKVIECKGSYGNAYHADQSKKDDDRPVDCSDVHGDNNDEVQLKVGKENHERVVGVRPDGTGTRFALVYVNSRGKESGS